MRKFRVQNYKKIDDTGWINCGKLTAFVGKNESGKSAIFRGLSKLNPSDGQKYDGLKEFPRRRYSSEFKTKDWIVSSAEFELSQRDIAELTKLDPIFNNIKYVICAKSYSNQITVQFEPQLGLQKISKNDYLNSLTKWKENIENLTAPEGKGEQLAPIKSSISSYLQTKINQLPQVSGAYVQPEIINEISTTILNQMNESWAKELFKDILDQNKKFVEKTKLDSKINDAANWIVSNIPQFIYFDRYDVIDSAIHISNFIQRLSQSPDDPRLRTTKCLFEHVGLDIHTIQKLDPTKPETTELAIRRLADERAILMSSASAAMTKKFSDWWEQRKHKFRYDVDGPHFRVWVSDDLDPSEIELDQRSAGMQYFFSFYLVFLVEAEKTHKNSILLLDEPGLQYHGTAQMKTVQFFRKISEQNQILYTTHSPFMIDGDHLEDARIVFEDKDTGFTKVSDNVWPDDIDSTFPLQAGLGYALAQTLFLSKKQLVVEGLTDYTLLKAMNELLEKKKMTMLNKDVVITPAGGTRYLMPLAGMLFGNKIKMAILLDADQPGIQKQKEMKEKLLMDCILINSVGNSDTVEIEDLFEEQVYLDAVKASYPSVELNFNSAEQQMKGISKRIKSLFDRTNNSFEKWKPNNVLISWIQSDPNGKHKISDKTCKYFESLFKEVNKKLEI